MGEICHSHHDSQMLIEHLLIIDVPIMSVKITTKPSNHLLLRFDPFRDFLNLESVTSEWLIARAKSIERRWNPCFVNGEIIGSTAHQIRDAFQSSINGNKFDSGDERIISPTDNFLIQHRCFVRKVKSLGRLSSQVEGFDLSQKLNIEINSLSSEKKLACD